MKGGPTTGSAIDKGKAKAALRAKAEAPARSRSTSDGRADNGPRKTPRTGRSSNSPLRGHEGRGSRTGSMSNKKT